MICIDNIFTNPGTAGLAAATVVLIYIILLSYSPYLPPAFFLSAMAGALVYLLKGGTLLCSQLTKSVAEEECTHKFN
jgi:hypothetical protein